MRLVCLAILLVEPLVVASDAASKANLVGPGASVDNLILRALRVSPILRADLEETVLGKGGHLAVVPVQRPTVVSGSSGPFQLRRHTVRRAIEKGEGVTAEVPQAKGPSRRQASFAVVGAVAGAALRLPFARAEPVASDEVLEGPGGLKYRDLIAGAGPVTAKGDKLTVNYVLNLANTGQTIETGKNYTFSADYGQVIPGWYMAVVGDGDVPAMQVGGVRQAIIPPPLGYGLKAGGCQPGGGCKIPPMSTLELVIDLKSIEKK